MKEVRDQSAHTVAAFVALLPAALFPHILTFALAGFALGMVREVTEEGVVSLGAARRASLLDLVFWTMGGAVAGLFT